MMLKFPTSEQVELLNLELKRMREQIKVSGRKHAREGGRNRTGRKARVKKAVAGRAGADQEQEQEHS